MVLSGEYKWDAELLKTGTGTSLLLHSSKLQQWLASLPMLGSFAHISYGMQPLVVVFFSLKTDVVALKSNLKKSYTVYQWFSLLKWDEFGFSTYKTVVVTRGTFFRYCDLINSIVATQSESHWHNGYIIWEKIE